VFPVTPPGTIQVGFLLEPATLAPVRCPACDCPLEETSASCPGCGFSLSLADAHYGAAPQASPRVADPQGHLSRASRATLLKAVCDFEQRFPSLRFTALFLETPSGVPARPFLFWLFNRCGIHSSLEKAGANRHILLWIDPAAPRLASMIGYGLEPLVPDECLQAAIDSASHLAATQPARAAVAFLRRLDLELADLHARLPSIFGWFPEDTWSDPADDLDPFLEPRFESGVVAY
jgi:hypothetical protein